MIQTYSKDPSDTMDYNVDYSLWMASGDEIDTSVWSTPTPVTSPALTVDDDDVVGDTTKVWLTGGVAETLYTVINTITTTGGRTKQETLYILCRDE